MSLAWHDLLGRPWKLHGNDAAGMDCSTVAEEVLRRMGGEPPPTSPFRATTSAGERGEMASYFGYLDESFERVSGSLEDATHAGDLVLLEDERGVARHLYVLVEPARGTFLTASEDYGVVAVRRFVIGSKDQRIVGVYRLRLEAAP
jgi:hypothetical protein